MKKLITITVTLALLGTLFTLAGKKVEVEIQNATAKASATATMINK